MKQQALFFDIDGTLWDYHNTIPASTVTAIRAAREKGHLAFINSGRSRGFINNEDLLGIGFDGIVSGCGTMIEFRGEILFYYQIPQDQMEETLRICRRCHARPILEGRRHLYLDYEDFGNDPYGRKLIAEVGDMLRPITGLTEPFEVSKFAVDMSPDGDTPALVEALSPLYNFIFHNEYIMEIVPKGFDKGQGILKTCELLDLDPAGTMAFGDGHNDLEMIRTAGIGVAMGDGRERLKQAADYVTAPLMEDGIHSALAHFGLL